VVGVAIGYYEAQNTRRKLARITTPLFANEESHWVRTVMGERSAMIGDRARRIVETYAQAPGDRMIVAWEWYWVDGTVTSSSIVAKFLTGWSRLAHHRDDSAAVLLYTRDTGDARGVETLRQFTRDAWPTIEAALRREARR
jgi:EpsI family protein